MEVYVWFEVVEYDYEGSDNGVLGVFSSREAALREIRKELPDAENCYDGQEWHLSQDHPKRRGDTHYWTIDEWTVRD